MDLLLPALVADGLRTRSFGRQIHYFEAVGSTNDIAKELAQAGAPEGTIVLAEEQTQGRGRLGRTWFAPPRSCLLLSLILRPNLAVADAFRLTMLCSLSAAVAVERVSGITPAIKWPNDLLVGAKKLAGILSEASSLENSLQYAIVGIGLNVNFDPSALPEVAASATSLSALAGHEVSRVRLLQELLAEVEARYPSLWPANEDALWADWRCRLGTLGQQVTVSEGGRLEHGLAVDVAPDGSLLLQGDDGRRVTIAVGDVTLRREDS